MVFEAPQQCELASVACCLTRSRDWCSAVVQSMLFLDLQAETKIPVQPEQHVEGFQMTLSRSKMLAVNRQIASPLLKTSGQLVPIIVFYCEHVREVHLMTTTLL